MTPHLRKSYLRPTPSLTPDRDEAKCHVRPEWFDELVQPKADPEVVEAIKHTCDACPLQVGCWAENAEEGWLKRVKGEQTPKGYETGQVWAQRKAERIAAIEDVIEADGHIDDLCQQLGIQPFTLYGWCRKHGLLDLFRTITGSREVIRARGEEQRARRQRAVA